MNVTFTILIAINLVGIVRIDNLIVDAVLSLSNSVLFVGVRTIKTTSYGDIIYCRHVIMPFVNDLFRNFWKQHNRI